MGKLQTMSECPCVMLQPSMSPSELWGCLHPPVRQMGTYQQGAHRHMCPLKVFMWCHPWMCLLYSTRQEDLETLLALERADIRAEYHQIS